MTKIDSNKVPPKVQNIIGNRYDRLLVVGYSHVKKHKYGTRHFWFVRCDCGNEKVMRGDIIKGNTTYSCGCYNAEQAKRTFAERNTTHGMSKTSIYYVWLAMRRRCNLETDAGYEHYGGRGIRVCDRWQHSFEAFYEDMGEPPIGHTLERINNDSNYSPDNCVWATMKEQCLNRRSNHLVTIGGVTKTVTEWSHEYRINPHTVFGRIHRGRNPVEAITTPIKGGKG